MRNRYATSFIACAALVLGIHDADASVKAKKPAVSFVAVGPAGLRIVGKTSELSVVENASRIEVDVPLAHLATGISLRDRHMREKYLEVGKYPVARLSIARDALALPKSGGQKTGDAQGLLNLHGKTHPVTVHWEATRQASGYAVRGTFHANMRDFGINVPRYLGVTVKPDVAIEAKFIAQETK